MITKLKQLRNWFSNTIKILSFRESDYDTLENEISDEINKEWIEFYDIQNQKDGSGDYTFALIDKLAKAKSTKNREKFELIFEQVSNQYNTIMERQRIQKSRAFNFLTLNIAFIAIFSALGQHPLWYLFSMVFSLFFSLMLYFQRWNAQLGPNFFLQFAKLNVLEIKSKIIYEYLVEYKILKMRINKVSKILTFVVWTFILGLIISVFLLSYEKDQDSHYVKDMSIMAAPKKLNPLIKKPKPPKDKYQENKQSPKPNIKTTDSSN